MKARVKGINNIMNITDFDEERFEKAKEYVKNIEEQTHFSQNLSVGRKMKKPVNSVSREGKTNIGGLSEGTLHLVLKYFLSPDNSYHEIKYGKNFIDVFIENHAYEVQTANFSSLKKKLGGLLCNIPVTIVYPVIREKYIIWVNPETGKSSEPRKSPKKENEYNIFYQLIYLRDYLLNENLSFCIAELSCTESKLLCGKYTGGKKGSVRLNRVPQKLYSVKNYGSFRELCSALIPETAGVTLKELCKGLCVKKPLAQRIMYVLKAAGFAQCTGKSGNEKIYCIKIKEKL